MAPGSRRVVLTCLIGLSLALLLVGLVSGTVLRHLVQIIPIVVAVGLLMYRPEWGAYASLPIFLFWIFIVVLIWLFLLGLSSVANGRYTAIEVLSTFLMVAFAAVGITGAVRLGRPLRLLGRVSTVIFFAGVQVAAMWVSFLQPIANR